MVPRPPPRTAGWCCGAVVTPERLTDSCNHPGKIRAGLRSQNLRGRRDMVWLETVDMLREIQTISWRNQMRVVTRQLLEQLRLRGVLALLSAHDMTNEFNVIAIHKPFQNLRGQRAVALVNLMEILNPMRLAAPQARLLGFIVSGRDGRRLGKTSHDSRSQPAFQITGIHCGDPTLLLELLSHVTCLGSPSDNQIRHEPCHDVTAGFG